MQSVHHVFSSREILLTEIYYNKIRSENIMILHLQHIKCVNLLACVPACACAIAHVSGNNSVDWCTRQEPLMKIFTISGKPSTPPSTCPQSFIIFLYPINTITSLCMPSKTSCLTATIFILSLAFSSPPSLCVEMLPSHYII